MTKEQAESLRIGDIVEFDNKLCYWLGKITGRDKDGDWKVKNHGKRAEGIHGTTILKYPENATLVGHSDIP